MADWPQPPAEWLAPDLEEARGVFMEVRQAALQALEGLKTREVCDNPLEASLELCLPQVEMATISRLGAELPSLLGVSSVELKELSLQAWEAQQWAPPQAGPSAVLVGGAFGRPFQGCDYEWERGDRPFYVLARRGTGEKCARCWMRLETVGQDLEHETLCARCAANVRALGLAPE
jgi:isoleucyl-tRNA synthetase